MVRLGYRFVCIGSGSNICFTEDKIIGSYLSLILERDGVKFIVESFNFIGGPKGTIVEKFIHLHRTEKSILVFIENEERMNP